MLNMTEMSTESTSLREEVATVYEDERKLLWTVAEVKWVLIEHVKIVNVFVTLLSPVFIKRKHFKDGHMWPSFVGAIGNTKRFNEPWLPVLIWQEQAK